MESLTSPCSDAAMPRPRPPHVHRETNRHGRVVWYVRIGHGPRVRLPCGPGGDGFDAAYRAAITGEIASGGRHETRTGSLAWLIERYRETVAWSDLAASTRKTRELIFRQMVTTAGHEPLSRITRDAVVAGRDARRETPFQARNFLQALRGLFAWAADADHVAADPTEGVKPPKARGREGGFAAWTEDDVAAFEARWPLATRPRVAFDVLRYTGLRRGDAARLGRQHVRDGVITIKTEKTGTVVTIRIVAPLAASIEAGPVGDLAYVTGEGGRPMTKESFGNAFRAWCGAAGVDKSAHGLRKLAATTMAEAGATVAELESIFGWEGGGMASLYTRSADRRRIGIAASTKLIGTPAEQSIPSPKRR